ncbi:MAG: hemerythrin domain-containing protein [Planctomycetes bacterium]|nr:hemerythrin domain-containing protein [Planctomycetota bacterium]
MKPLETLKAEHSLIRQYLTVLSQARETMEEGGRVPKQVFELAVRFSRDFVDKYHHFKEELQLFTLLAQKHGGDFDGPIGALRNQHENGRDHVTAIDRAKEGYDLGRATEAGELLEHLAAYISMLRQHIHTEDHGIYQRAEALLTADENRNLEREFRRADEKAGPGFFDKARDSVLQMDALLKA